MLKQHWIIGVALALLGGSLTACQPKTTSEKVADKMEDAGHETGQAVERAGERVKDAAD